MPNYLDDLYIVKLAYHAYDIVPIILFNRNRRDFSEFILHHIVTLALVFVSYVTNFLPIGAVIMLIHDFPDIFVCIMKITADLCGVTGFAISYVFMVFTWGYFRLYIFPFYTIIPLYVYAHDCDNKV